MTTPPETDRFSITGQFPTPTEHARLLIIGAGPAGLAAAIAAAEAGLAPVLIDENPIPAALMGLDVPLFYGNRMTGAVQQQDRMIERLVAANPAIEQAFDAGVDLRLGITAWGAFANGPALHAVPTPMAGLSDAEHSWLCGFDSLILATGSRDLVLGFQGIDLPGVMGVRALLSLLTQYDAFSGQSVVFLGSGDLAAQAALTAQSRGLKVVALVEALPEPQACATLQHDLAAAGIRIICDHSILRAEGDATSVTAARLATRDGQPGERLACDTICLAIGTVPAIELADILGCRLVAAGDRGGHIIETGAHGATSIPGIFAAGDCAGLGGDALAQGRAAALAAAAWLAGTQPAQGGAASFAGPDAYAYRQAWMRALVQSGGLTAPVCLCEEVSRGDLLGIQPPRYLNAQCRGLAARDSATLLEDGPLNPDQIKRLTRAGMGPCQGRRCREQIALLLAQASNQSPCDIPLASYRAPVRPLPLDILADRAGAAANAERWDVWFGIRTQWIAYDAIGTQAEAEALSNAEHGGMHL
jgi:thioredoxin reductase